MRTLNYLPKEMDCLINNYLMVSKIQNNINYNNVLTEMIRISRQKKLRKMITRFERIFRARVLLRWFDFYNNNLNQINNANVAVN